MLAVKAPAMMPLLQLSPSLPVNVLHDADAFFTFPALEQSATDQPLYFPLSRLLANLGFPYT